MFLLCNIPDAIETVDHYAFEFLPHDLNLRARGPRWVTGYLRPRLPLLASQIDVRFVDDLATYIGQKLLFRITRYEPRNLVLSRRALLEEDNAKRAIETRKKIEPGAVLRGN